mmetsp:Transcript_39456/g.63977  ORF Transcript_39456/g.63977 Transcript_39456/m.63977 type:complete len:176 (+) Transcript_39456:35-562(+)|eukprot:CAMPEP_0184656450 /NCGR_PEP_ID=MMETSP0308-20130426/16518_1 /TAXON_ID=38269 /ORGANISM="Gloeochaete witrockiana, Strain SAG 46.84" /LENGTH=175 /DNA_ID=CAMNT_0027093591 /DNA_START=10 /DNA_END=537 /DNA_ORIENTATION=-
MWPPQGIYTNVPLSGPHIPPPPSIPVQLVAGVGNTQAFNAWRGPNTSARGDQYSQRGRGHRGNGGRGNAQFEQPSYKYQKTHERFQRNPQQSQGSHSQGSRYFKKSFIEDPWRNLVTEDEIRLSLDAHKLLRDPPDLVAFFNMTSIPQRQDQDDRFAGGGIPSEPAADPDEISLE